MKHVFFAIALILPATGCVPDGDSFYMPTDIAPMFGGAVARRSVPQSQPATPNLTGTAGAFYAREVHGAVHRSDCLRMLERFRREGRSIELVDVTPNDIGTGGVLEFKCVFETYNGESAQDGYYEPERRDLN